MLFMNIIIMTIIAANCFFRSAKALLVIDQSYFQNRFINKWKVEECNRLKLSSIVFTKYIRFKIPLKESKEVKEHNNLFNIIGPL